MTKISHHLVSPDCAQLTALPTGKLTIENLKLIRELPSIGINSQKPLEHLRYTTKVGFCKDNPALEMLLIEPVANANRLRPVIYFVHGGGMISGSADQVLHDLPNYAKQLDFVIASIDYRLAPEAQFPAQQDDLLFAYKWLLDNASELHIDATNIVLMGVSAGGGLVASFAQLLRDKGLPQAAAQILIYPMLDHRTGTRHSLYDNPYTGEFVWTAQNNQFGWQSLQGDYQASDERKGWFSPALAENLADLPPTFMACGALDLFVDENIIYSQRLIASGVPTELHVYSGAVHAFNVVQKSELSAQYTQDLLRFLSKQLSINS